MTRRSLTHVGGASELAGNSALAEALSHALAVPHAAQGAAEEGPDRAHVHGFHTYPARMHPMTAARLVGAFSAGGGVVLDPFCGSGTVLVEAMIAGRRAVGGDLSPLAVRLARLKTRVRAKAERDALSARAREVAAFADARRKARAGATRRYGEEDVALFEPHVLLELDGLRAGIAALPAGSAREALEMVFSAILVKISRRRGDTADGPDAARRIGAGYPARLFVKKADDLAARLADFAAALPKPAPPDAKVELDDATRLDTVRDASVDCVVTSPPYAATYDYVTHHAARMRWLGLDDRAFADGELGARRRYSALSPRDAHDAWTREVAAFLSALARVMRPGARAVFLVADSAVRGTSLRADEVFAAVAPREGLALIARASQERPHFHGPTLDAFRTHARREHALVLEPLPGFTPRPRPPTPPPAPPRTPSPSPSHSHSHSHSPPRPPAPAPAPAPSPPPPPSRSPASPRPPRRK